MNIRPAQKVQKVLNLIRVLTVVVCHGTETPNDECWFGFSLVVQLTELNTMKIFQMKKKLFMKKNNQEIQIAN